MTVMTKEQIEALLDGTTPGPWRISPTDDTMVQASDRSEVADITGDYNDPDLWPIMEANARLIAATPDLARTALALHQQLADAQAAQALVVERAADSLLECSVWCDSQERTDASWHNGVIDARKHHMARIRALADPTGVEALAALRAERDEWKRLAVAGELTARNLAIVEAERDDLRTRLAAAEAQVGALREALIDHNDILRSTFHIAEREGVKGMVASTNWDAFYNRVAVILKRYHKLRNEASAALASSQGVKHD